MSMEDSINNLAGAITILAEAMWGKATSSNGLNASTMATISEEVVKISENETPVITEETPVVEPAKKRTRKKKAEPIVEDVLGEIDTPAAEEEEIFEVKPITIEDLQALGQDLVTLQNSAVMAKEIVASFGNKKLSGIDVKLYPEVKAKFEEEIAKAKAK